MHVTNSSWHGNGGLLFLFHHQRFLYNISLLPSGALYLEGFLSTKQTAFITKQFISLFIIIQRHMRLLIRASDQQEIITKTTSIDTVPAPGKANRCLHLCNFKEFLNNLVASTTRTYNVCLTRGDTSGDGQAGQPYHQGLRLLLSFASATLSLFFMLVASWISQDVCSCSGEYSEVQVKGQSQQALLSVTFPRKSKASSETPLQTLCFLHHNWIPWLLLAARGSGKVSIWQSILGVILGHHMGLAYGHAGKNVGPLARERVGRAASG